jgi:hypothetical protein
MKYWKFWWNKMRMIKNSFFTTVKHISVFSLASCRTTFFYTKLKGNSSYSWGLWYENYHISLVAIATCEILIFTPLDENKSCIYRRNLNILYTFAACSYLLPVVNLRTAWIITRYTKHCEMLFVSFVKIKGSNSN